jgi:hypothetical protein
MKSDDFQDRALAPHQERFIENFFGADSERVVALRWAPGLGSLAATAHIIQRCLEVDPGTRALVLGSRLMLVEQMATRLSRLQVFAQSVDRYFFRSIQDAAADKSNIWMPGAAFLMGIDFAKQEDVAQSLSASEWGLIVVLDAESCTNKREHLIASLVLSSPNARILLLASSDSGDLPAFGIGHVQEFTYRLQDILRGEVPEVQISETIAASQAKQHTDSEKHFFQSLRRVGLYLADKGGVYLQLANALMRANDSSPAATEEVLRKLRGFLVHGVTMKLSTQPKGASEAESFYVEHAAPIQDSKLMEDVETLLQQLDEMSSDSKYAVLLGMLRSKNEKPPVGRPTCTCILTKSVATLSYLQVALEDDGFSVFELRPEAKFEELCEQVRRGKEHGGILLAIENCLQPEMDLAFIEDLILYDPPDGPSELPIMLRLFQGLERAISLKVSYIGTPKQPESGQDAQP